MAKDINEKIEIMNRALNSLHDGVDLYSQHQNSKSGGTEEKIELALRDSMIQRFEYCTDLLWKLIKVYLQDVQKRGIESGSPRPIIRDAVEDGLLSEKDAEFAMQMITTRNKTSHIYHEETAEAVAQEVPNYYSFMKQVVDHIATKI